MASWIGVAIALALSLIATREAVAQLAGEVLLSGFRNPVAVVPDPVNPGVFFVVEQDGLVRVARDGLVLSEPFLDLRGRLSSGGERGLLGLAFAPDAAESGRFFVNFTNTTGATVIARFRRQPADALVADPASRLDLEWPDGRRVIAQPFSNHNGGHLAFGPDRYLYVGLGDGGSAGDPMHLAQNPQALLGKMLRLDVNVPDEDLRGYRIPEDNPFITGNPIRALAEIWAFGLRNPWRYSFDDWTRGGTGALTIADVGQNAREEVDFEPAGRGGRNYGWRLREGRLPFDARQPAAFGPLIEPMHDYPRSQGASITGGFVYRGDALDPQYHGRYFFGDFVSGRVFSLGLHLHPDTSEATADDEREHTPSLGGRAVVGQISSFGVDHHGELLIVNYAGSVVRIVPDLAVVPAAPLLRAVLDAGRIALAWDARSDGVASHDYLVERVRDNVVSERVASSGLDATLEWRMGDCFRVRGRSRAGLAGPPSNLVCP
ncbi:MAG: PQQ-dependent sugar dehydrogenase [Acidobacteriota bacterium]